MSAIQDPGSSESLGIMNEGAAFIRQRPMLHFVVSELQAGVASLTVYGGFLAVSFMAEKLTETLPLKYSAPAHFLDLVFAWGAAFSGAFTFLVYTLASVLRLVRQVWQQES